MSRASSRGVEISPAGAGAYRLTTELEIDRSLEEVFDFFSDPHNLGLITPRWLSLHVRSAGRIAMSEGTRIRYRFRVRGVPAVWHSEITAWDPPRRFVDTQRLGPFRQWAHEHTFEQVGRQTVARDSVVYKVPGGRLVHRLFVQRDLRRLFSHRHAALRQIFSAKGASSPQPH